MDAAGQRGESHAMLALQGEVIFRSLTHNYYLGDGDELFDYLGGEFVVWVKERNSQKGP